MAEDAVQPAGTATPVTTAPGDDLSQIEAQLPGTFTGYSSLQHALNIELPSLLNRADQALSDALAILR